MESMISLYLLACRGKNSLEPRRKFSPHEFCGTIGNLALLHKSKEKHGLNRYSYELSFQWKQKIRR
jgi:hypothetical protein